MSQLEVDKIIPQSGTTLTIGDSGDTVNFADGTSIGIDTNTLYIDSTNNRVGIGTTSPTRPLTVFHSTLPILSLHNNTTGQNPDDGFQFQLSSDDGYVWNYESGGNVIFGAGGSEAMRIASDGNVYIATTTEASDDVGHAFLANGRAYHTADNTYVGLFNRKTSDGEIVQFRKDNTVIGKIGTRGSNLYVGNDDVALKYSGSNDYIVPSTGVDGSGRNNAIDLGASGTAFKDLYLGGGLYVGGTGSANYLDDYEEGTWTPAWNATGTAPTVTHSAQNGTYTKVGRLVTVKCQVQTNSSGISGGSGDLTITGLPFTTSNESDNGTGAISFVSFISLNSNYTTFGIEAFRNTTYFRWVQYGSNNSGLTVPVGNASSSNSVNVGFTATYYTA